VKGGNGFSKKSARGIVKRKKMTARERREFKEGGKSHRAVLFKSFPFRQLRLFQNAGS
jgi:hypothetical protein